MTPFELFGKIYDLPPAARNALLSAGIPRVLPIARGLGIKVRHVDEGRAVTTMPLSRRSKNHIGTMYMGAMLIQAETTMATLAIGLCRPPAFRVLVKRNEADYVRTARGRVRAECAPEGEERQGLERCRALVDGKDEAWLTVRMTSEDDGQPVATMRFQISVKRVLAPS